MRCHCFTLASLGDMPPEIIEGNTELYLSQRNRRQFLSLVIQTGLFLGPFRCLMSSAGYDNRGCMVQIGISVLSKVCGRIGIYPPTSIKAASIVVLKIKCPHFIVVMAFGIVRHHLRANKNHHGFPLVPGAAIICVCWQDINPQ